MVRNDCITVTIHSRDYVAALHDCFSLTDSANTPNVVASECNQLDFAFFCYSSVFNYID